jgi:hypothetical protein
MALQSTTALATITLQSASAEVTFSGIPATYRDLVVVFNGSISTSNNSPFYMNGDTTSGNYGKVSAWGTGSGTGSGAFFGAIWAGYPNVVTYTFLDASQTDKHKTALVRCNGASNEVSMQAIRWANTAAITSLTFAAGSTYTYTAGSTFSLYGVIA